jgi:hypothetical protein
MKNIFTSTLKTSSSYASIIVLIMTPTKFPIITGIFIAELLFKLHEIISKDENFKWPCDDGLYDPYKEEYVKGELIKSAAYRRTYDKVKNTDEKLAAEIKAKIDKIYTDPLVAQELERYNKQQCELKAWFKRNPNVV